MPFGLALTSLIVRDYDEAISFFTQKLGFELVVDKPALTSIGNRPKRWVEVRPPETQGEGGGLLLAQADGEAQETLVGKQFGGRVGFFWHVRDFDGTFERLKAAGVAFDEKPRSEGYGRVVVFRDLYGNKWDLIEPVVGV